LLSRKYAACRRHVSCCVCNRCMRIWQVPQLQQPRDWLRKSKPKARSGGWHSLTKQQQPGTAAGARVSFQPQHSAQHARPPEHNSGEFPSLSGSSGRKQPDGPPNDVDDRQSGGGVTNNSRSYRSDRRPHTPLHDERQTTAPPAASATADSSADGDDPALSKDFARVLGKSASAKREAEVEESSSGGRLQQPGCHRCTPGQGPTSCR
jgi:hypothetical protein